MQCEVSEDGERCGGTAVATVIQVTHQASPGAEHAACHEHARDGQRHGCRVVEMHDDEIEWQSAEPHAPSSPCVVYGRSAAGLRCSLGTQGCGLYHGR